MHKTKAYPKETIFVQSNLFSFLQKTYNLQVLSIGGNTLVQSIIIPLFEAFFVIENLKICKIKFYI